LSKLKKNPLLRKCYYFIKSIKQYLTIKPFHTFKEYCWYINQLSELKKKTDNPNFNKIIYYPCLFDNLKTTPLEPTYFYQDSWAAKKLFELKPAKHVDVGSSAKTIGILSQFTPITMVDIRPIELSLDGLEFKKGSILKLPFEDNSVESLSSMCVIEHIGLGRYGDDLDAFGSEKSINELKRILKPGGTLLISVPIDKENIIYFNAHRAFSKKYLFDLLSDFIIMEERYLYGKEVTESFDQDKGFGTVFLMLKKK